MDGSQCAGAGALLLLGVAGAGGTLGAGQDTAGSQDQDVAVRELLLELTGQTKKRVSLLESCFGGKYHQEKVTGKERRGKKKLTAAEHGGSPAGKGRGQR